jgi:hypothetical protein
MNSNFADWYRAATVDPYQVPLNERWAGVDAVTKALTESAALDLVRLAFGLTKLKSGYETSFREHFKAADPAFPMRQNDLEIQILACSTILNSLGSAHQHALILAMATLCMHFDGNRGLPVISEIVTAALSYYYKTARDSRDGSDSSITAVKATKMALPEEVKTQPATELTWANTASIAAAGDTALAKLAKSVNEALNDMNERLLLQQEETNILWWLFGEHSVRPIKAIQLFGAGAPLVAGNDLAALTVFLPGHPSSEAFLSKMLSSTKPSASKVIDSVCNVNISEWLSEISLDKEIIEVSDICILHGALEPFGPVMIESPSEIF